MILLDVVLLCSAQPAHLYTVGQEILAQTGSQEKLLAGSNIQDEI